MTSGFGWRLRSPAFRRAHYAGLHAVLAVVVAVARVLFGLRIVDDEVGWSPLDDGVTGFTGFTNAMVRLSRHAGPVDSLLLMRTLMSRFHLRQPRIVLKHLLQLDPLLDVDHNRLPTAFLRSGDDGNTARIGRVVRSLGEQDAVLIFPEAANFSGGLRRTAIDRLRMKGMVE